MPWSTAGGWLWWTVWGDPERPDPFHEALVPILQERAPHLVVEEARAPAYQRDIARRAADIASVGAFDAPVEETFTWDGTHDPASLRAIFATFGRLDRATRTAPDRASACRRTTGPGGIRRYRDSPVQDGPLHRPTTSEVGQGGHFLTSARPGRKLRPAEMVLSTGSIPWNGLRACPPSQGLAAADVAVSALCCRGRHLTDEIVVVLKRGPTDCLTGAVVSRRQPKEDPDAVMPHLRARIVLQDSEKDGHDIRDTQFALSASFAAQPVKRDDPDTRHWIAEGVAEHLGRSVVVAVVKGVQAVPSYPRVRVMASRDPDGLDRRDRLPSTPHSLLQPAGGNSGL